MKPYFEEDGITIYHGDCREVLSGLERVDLVLTDPPYGTGWRRGGGKLAGDFDGRHERADWDVWSTDWVSLINAPEWRICCPARTG